MIYLTSWSCNFEKAAHAAFFVYAACAASAFTLTQRSRLIKASASAGGCICFPRISQPGVLTHDWRVSGNRL